MHGRLRAGECAPLYPPRALKIDDGIDDRRYAVLVCFLLFVRLGLTREQVGDPALDIARVGMA
jgi:hypothetical protein